MRVALVSTCALQTPPKAYGGTELIVAELAKALTGLGHDVTVFATGNSRTAGELRWHFDAPTWPPDDLIELRHAARAWESIRAEDPPFDVVHAHQAMAVPFAPLCSTPTVLTLHHERADRLVHLYSDFREVTYIAISRRQAELIPEVGVCDVVHHGLDVDPYEASPSPGGWLAFVGRFAPEKGAHVAIDAALTTGLRIRLGGEPHPGTESYFERELRPRLALAGDRVVWHGEVSFGPKLDILRGARATLCPLLWEEPFGLVMIESMLVGTPVIAFRRGAAPEVIDEGVTGFIVDDVAEMVDRIRQIGAIDRKRCRQHARERWNSARMARDYERVYSTCHERGARATREYERRTGSRFIRHVR